MGEGGGEGGSNEYYILRPLYLNLVERETVAKFLPKGGGG